MLSRPAGLLKLVLKSVFKVSIEGRNLFLVIKQKLLACIPTLVNRCLSNILQIRKLEY